MNEFYDKNWGTARREVALQIDPPYCVHRHRTIEKERRDILEYCRCVWMWYHFLELSYLRWNPFLYCRTHQFAESEHHLLLLLLYSSTGYGLFIIGKHLKIVSLSCTNKKERQIVSISILFVSFPPPGHPLHWQIFFAFIIRIGRAHSTARAKVMYACGCSSLSSDPFFCVLNSVWSINFRFPI